jgi:hypothetical protein
LNALRLHPRLPRAYAVLRWDSLKGMDAATARMQLADIVPEEAVWTATGAPRMTEDDLLKLRDALVGAVAELPFGEPLSTAQRDAFDNAITHVYAEHARLFPAEAAHLEVWSYHAFVLVPDLALWRWSHMETPNIERFVGIDLTRHTFGRLWWRWYTFTGGQLDDPHGWALLEGLKEADLDQLQSRRGAYGVDPPIVRALAEIYIEVKERSTTSGVSSRDLWRDLLKRLLRRGAFVAFGALDADVLKAAAREQLEVTIAALTSDGLAPDTPMVRAPAWQSFDDVQLRHIVVAVTEAVEDAGTLDDSALPDAVQQRLGVEVPGRFRPVLAGFAWMGATLGYIRRDEDRDRWHLGPTPPAPDNRWGDWTPAKIRKVAANNGGVDADLIGTVFSGRAGQTVRRTIRASVNHTIT